MSRKIAADTPATPIDTVHICITIRNAIANTTATIGRNIKMTASAWEIAIVSGAVVNVVTLTAGYIALNVKAPYAEMIVGNNNPVYNICNNKNFNNIRYINMRN